MHYHCGQTDYALDINKNTIRVGYNIWVLKRYMAM